MPAARSVCARMGLVMSYTLSETMKRKRAMAKSPAASQVPPCSASA